MFLDEAPVKISSLLSFARNKFHASIIHGNSVLHKLVVYNNLFQAACNTLEQCMYTKALMSSFGVAMAQRKIHKFVKAKEKYFSIGTAFWHTRNTKLARPGKAHNNQ